jgi:hypothetical protein
MLNPPRESPARTIVAANKTARLNVNSLLLMLKLPSILNLIQLF